MLSKCYHSFVYRKISIWHIVIFYLPQNCIQNWPDKIEFVHRFSLCIYRHDTMIVRMKILRYFNKPMLSHDYCDPKTAFSPSTFVSLVVSLHSYIHEFQGKPSFHLFPRPCISDLASLQLSAEHTNWFLSPKFRKLHW